MFLESELTIYMYLRFVWVEILLEITHFFFELTVLRLFTQDGANIPSLAQTNEEKRIPIMELTVGCEKAKSLDVGKKWIKIQPPLAVVRKNWP